VGRSLITFNIKQEKKTVFIHQNAKTGTYKSYQRPTCGYASGARQLTAKEKINSGGMPASIYKIDEYNEYYGDLDFYNNNFFLQTANIDTSDTRESVECHESVTRQTDYM
jgi:hypothetical protein